MMDSDLITNHHVAKPGTNPKSQVRGGIRPATLPVPNPWKPLDSGSVVAFQTKYQVLLPDTEHRMYDFSELSNVRYTQFQDRELFGFFG